ncbi:RNA 2',3'-cyclic phosphodiesterase [Bacillus sp. CLL-7-23]|uniref:RNA 2',3'-cyclic phosphodiesterase n=1 Tax=Bacillus changyiensis TaxID=3004103 RepID=A0ABT4X6D6_9BACI|nr:RNA 2',3'-cyclic phosphodiesterase [Bacillus changyiensis]MDA7027284.1 RNA 2',3'-cyclic phosphodiesterase [Bacillus changyiensis]
MSVQPHYFIGIPFPAELSEHLQQMMKNDPDFSFHKWVHPLDYHLTLVFLGSADRDQLLALENKLQLIAEHISSFRLTLKKTGTFGKSSQPRIFYVEPEYSKILLHVREKVKRAASEVGFVIENRPFHPHITIARKWKSTVPFHGHTKTLKNEISFTAKQFVIFATHLDQLPKYEHKTVIVFGEQMATDEQDSEMKNNGTDY